ncbi:hypothetical protein [Priestia megaterium]|uniref:hypothetical protein n=1 Tax=Priestia megaterium TaxID=1404 RepID=UPI00366BEC2C
MFEHDKEPGTRKFAWVGKWAKMTGERAKIDAKANGTYIVYKKGNELVKEYADGTIEKFNSTNSGNN